MTTALFHLRCLEIGLPIRDLELLTIGMVIDMWTESNNDRAETDKKGSDDTVRMATQDDYNRF